MAIVPAPGGPGKGSLSEEERRLLASRIREIPDFPVPGVAFKDITPLLADPVAFRIAVEGLARTLEGLEVEAVVGIESRGFLFGAPLALRLGAAFIPARKPGRLPAERVRVDYALEYGEAALEMHRDALRPGTRAAIVDDLLATGGTSDAARFLVEELGGRVVAFAYVIELEALGGRKRLAGRPVRSLLRFGAPDGEAGRPEDLAGEEEGEGAR